MTEPTLTHQDLAQVCPLGTRAALSGAPMRCLWQAQSRSLAALTRSLKLLQHQLEDLLKHSAPELM